jgi:hypothetical protein
MKSKLVQIATLALAVMAVAGTAAAQSEKVAVIQIKAIDGKDVRGGNVTVNRSERFTTGSQVRVNRGALNSLTNVKTLVLVDRRVDAKSGDNVVQSYTQEVLAMPGDQFTVKDAEGRDMTYTVDILQDGSVDLIGPGDRIVVRGGGEYKIWKIEKTSLVSGNRILLSD